MSNYLNHLAESARRYRIEATNTEPESLEARADTIRSERENRDEQNRGARFESELLEESALRNRSRAIRTRRDAAQDRLREIEPLLGAEATERSARDAHAAALAAVGHAQEVLKRPTRLVAELEIELTCLQAKASTQRDQTAAAAVEAKLEGREYAPSKKSADLLASIDHTTAQLEVARRKRADAEQQVRRFRDELAETATALRRALYWSAEVAYYEALDSFIPVAAARAAAAANAGVPIPDGVSFDLDEQALDDARVKLELLIPHLPSEAVVDGD